MVEKMTGILPPADPTAEEVYEYMLDGLYAGRESGSVEAPTGWFAMVQWPENEQWYIVGEDNLGFKYLAHCEDKDQADREFGTLEDAYAAWDSEGDGDGSEQV